MPDQQSGGQVIDKPLGMATRSLMQRLRVLHRLIESVIFDKLIVGSPYEVEGEVTDILGIQFESKEPVEVPVYVRRVVAISLPYCLSSQLFVRMQHAVRAMGIRIVA